MPPYAAELETWWLGTGYEALKQLVNDESDDLNSRQCGFAQQMQTRLLAFDNDQTIQASLQTTWPAIRAARGVDYDANSRKNSKYIASNIFRKPKDGGIDFERAMDGLGYLDAIEIRRLRLLEATHAAMETILPTESQLQMLQELDRTSTANFRLLHAGFRACILIKELTRDSEYRKEIPQIMGMLNALVPSDVFLEDEDDVDPTPHSPSLRDSIRFSVFEHLMSESPFSPQLQEIVKMKLSSWCEVPGYPQARDAMVRYCEEFKKLEGMCLAIMNDLERKSFSIGSYHVASPTSSTLFDTDTSRSSGFSANATQGASAIFTTATPNDNQDSAPTTPLSPWVLSTSHPLLKGMPGREMSPAKTDGALFSQDLSAPPVLSYPDSLSKTEFFQHPFTRKLDMSPIEQAALGLILPREIDSRDFYINCGEPILLPTFMDTLRFNMSDAQVKKISELDKEAGDGRGGADPEEKDMVVPRRVLAGGEVEDWRPMSEYEPDENDEIASAITPLEASKDNDPTEDSDETTKGTGTAARFACVDDAVTFQNQQTPSLPDPGTPSSRQSVRKKDLIGDSDQADRQVHNDSGSFRLSRQLSRICKEEMSVFDFATPRPRGKTVGCTPQPLATTDTRSPLARFPIAVEPTHRLTPGTLTKRVVGDSGGKLLFEDTRQARLIPSPSDKYHQGLSADLWEADTESIISELQPSPLHINRRKHRANTDESDRRWPRLFDRGYAGPPTTLEMLRISAPTERDDSFDPEVFGDDDDTPTEGDRKPRGLGHQEQGLLQATPAPRGLQRSASTIVTPTQPMKRLEHKASFNLEAMAQSGFTPEHRRESISRGTFPRSGMMLNLQSTQERLRCPPQESNGIQMSKSITEKTSKVRRLPDLPDSGRHERAFAPKEWMRAIAATPRKSRTVSRNDGRIENHGEASSGSDWPKTLFQPSATMDEGDVERSTSATTRDFSQPHKLQKPPSRARLTPSSTYRSSNQQLDHSTRASSLIPPGSEADVPDPRTPSPTASQTTAVPRTPSSSISSIFRKRIRSDYNPPATPRTPAEPTLAWSPFANCEPEPPCASPWVSGNGEGKREKERRAAYFRDKVEREFQSRQSPKRSSRKDSLESAANGDSAVQSNVATDNRTSKESLIQWKQFLEDAPEPLFSSPRPPVPPLPSESQLNLALDRPPRQTQTPSRATARVEVNPAATYRDKKPQGLTVETRKLRKAMREGAQTPSRNKTMTPASGSSFRSAFRLEGRRMSFGRPAADHESQGKGRETETFPRCK
ncbi:hypothetical protein FOFC_14940 [Fusarium oxysporum]|nr:hypothetical protein FOFC_14940 [Fusarium oxysporum]